MPRSAARAPSVPIRSAPSSVDLRRRSGQPSCWTCATTTSRHSRPLARWAVSSRTAAPRAPRSAKRVGGDLLGDQGREELACADAVAGLLRPGGRVEQGADRVEVAVRATSGAAAELDRAPQPGRPAGARPQGPEQLLGGGADVELGPGATDELGDRPRPIDLVADQPVEHGRVEHGLPDQLARVHRLSIDGGRVVLLAPPQLPGQAAYVAGVQPAERSGQQRLGPRGVDVVDVVGVVVVEVEHHPQARRSAGARPGRGPAAPRRWPPRPAPRRRRGIGAAAGWTGGRTAPARPSRPTRCRPRGAPDGAGRPGARPRPGHCRRCAR